MKIFACKHRFARILIALALSMQSLGCSGPVRSPDSTPAPTPPTTTPIKHLIVVIGENRSFENLFGTYAPLDTTQSVDNLLSRQIVNKLGLPGTNFSAAAQFQANGTGTYQLSPPKTGPFSPLPQPNTTVGPLEFPPSVKYNITSDPGLDADSQVLLNAGGIFPQLPFFPDYRFPSTLVNGPFTVTHYMNYAGTTGDPAHRFFQMWQQSDCSVANATTANPSGCTGSLYVWVATTVGWGTANTPPPSPFNNQSTFQGGVSMGFFNMAAGDVPYFYSLANTYAISDNYHQFIMGGTGPNSISFGTADVLVYSDSNGNPVTPPADQIANPNPFAGSNNWYQQDGFYIVDSGNTSNSAYVNCSDLTQPGVAPIRNYLASLPYQPFRSGNCATGAFYLVNNNLPAYERNGTLRADQTHTVGVSSTPTIGDALSAKGISWSYYGEGFDANSPVTAQYCGICNPFQYSKSIMTTSLKNNLHDLTQFFEDVKNNTLPAVSFIKPDEIVDGHPGSSFPALFEAFSRNIVNTVKANDAVWKESAILITFDEAGGLYDVGYIQPIDYFGDGPRVPMIVVSPFAKPGYVDHTYNDHASVLKFIEKNWSLSPLSPRSRDNLPNPVSTPANPYVPTNNPAIGDLMTLFNFSP